MTDYTLRIMASVRHRLHACRSNYKEAMYELIVLGLSPDNADRYLHCLPLRERRI